MQIANAILTIGLLFGFLFQPVQAPAAESSADLISAINGYRTANGLHALNYNSSLMVSAQAQADYMASTGIISHVGPGGSNAKDRAIAAGYGDGAHVYGSEIIYGGSYATVDVAMGWWKLSPNHNPYILSTSYVDIGAGIAYSGDYVYFAVTMFYKPGGSVPQAPTATFDPNATHQPANPPAPLIVPVVAATEAEDGSIIHIVRTGQSMWNISAVYGVELETLYALNDMTKWDVIYPGDEIIVKPSDNSPTITEIALLEIGATLDPDIDSSGESETQLPTATQTKTVTPSPTSRYTPTATEPIILNLNSTDDVDKPDKDQAEGIDSNLQIIIGGAFTILMIILGISLFGRNQPEEPQ